MEQSPKATRPIVFEVFVADDALEGGAVAEHILLDVFELIGEGNRYEDGILECPIADSFEVFVDDDAFEGGALAECDLFDDFELIGESDTREDGAASECSRS